MAFFGLFGDKNKDEFKQFEKIFKQVWAKKSARRQSDRRDAFLTPDLLRRRREVTKSGKQKLILDFGSKGRQVSYTLADLNKMATAMGKAEGKFSESTRGVTVAELIGSSRKIDIERAKSITNSTLYKFDGSILMFRSRAGDDSEFAYHQVKIRLEDWEHEVRAGKGESYMPAAMQAARGRVSFDCDCGRHQYWYRYLATIGGFALDPKEFAFPKIRNPKLQGCCCKHVIKTLAVLQAPFVQSRIALEMKDQAQKKGWFSRLLNGERPTETFMQGEDLQASEKSGNVDIQKAFTAMKKARMSFGQKMKALLKGRISRKDEKTMDVTGKGTVAEAVAKKEIGKRRQLEKDVAIQKMATSLALKIYRDKMNRDDAVASYAKDTGLDLKEAKDMAKQINV
jgi:hypothetical protein